MHNSSLGDQKGKESLAHSLVSEQRCRERQFLVSPRPNPILCSWVCRGMRKSASSRTCGFTHSLKRAIAAPRPLHHCLICMFVFSQRNNGIDGIGQVCVVGIRKRKVIKWAAKWYWCSRAFDRLSPLASLHSVCVTMSAEELNICGHSLTTGRKAVTIPNTGSRDDVRGVKWRKMWWNDEKYMWQQDLVCKGEFFYDLKRHHDKKGWSAQRKRDGTASQAEKIRCKADGKRT